jgi:hypothetical protein
MRRWQASWRRLVRPGWCGFVPTASCPTTGTSCYGPTRDGLVAAFMQQLTTKPVRRRQLQRGRLGVGHVYQGRLRERGLGPANG